MYHIVISDPNPPATPPKFLADILSFNNDIHYLLISSLSDFINYPCLVRRGLFSSNLKIKDIIYIPAYKADVSLHWLLKY